MSRFGAVSLALYSLAGCAPDYIASHAKGRTCSAGLLQKGENWCAPPERPPVPQPYCTQSWNGTDCWSRPDLMPNVPKEMYGGPRGLTQEQNAQRLNMPVEKVPPVNPFFP